MSTIAAMRAPFRAEDLLNPEIPEKFVEIIEGELVSMTPAGWKHNQVGFRFQTLFAEFCKTSDDLTFGCDNDGFLIQRNPDVMLCPDAALFRKRNEGQTTWLEFAPEIAVEVLSPSNSAAEIAYKRQKLFQAGTEQVWIADPRDQSLEFCFRDGRRLIARGDETIQGEGVAEGMRIGLKEILSVGEA